MKKLLVGFLCATTMTFTAVSAFASETSNAYIFPNHAVTVTQESSAVQYTLNVNGKNVDIGTLKIVEIKEQIMVPLKITAEALGFTVMWDGVNQVIHLDNGTLQTNLTIGEEIYFISSSKAIGMTAPQSLEVAPIIMTGSTYVPM